jgi:hypothetical protein
MYFNQIGTNPLHTIAAFMAGFDRICQAYDQWMAPILLKYNQSHSMSTTSCTIADAFNAASPRVRSVPTISVIVELDDNFTVYFDNLMSGGGATTVAPALSKRAGCTSIRVTDDNLQSLLISVFESSAVSSRWFSWMDDGDGMRFMSGGNKLPQEDEVFLDPPTRLTSRDLSLLVESLGGRLDFDPDQKIRCNLIRVQM